MVYTLSPSAQQCVALTFNADGLGLVYINEQVSNLILRQVSYLISFYLLIFPIRNVRMSKIYTIPLKIIL